MFPQGGAKMAIADKLQEKMSKLPEPLQNEILDFAEYLVRKFDRQERQADREWANLSLQHALRGIEDESLPCYNLSDLKVVFQ
jgi:hypothetical protein